MWEEVTESVTEVYTDKSSTTDKLPGIKRLSDGFTLVGIGLGREFQQTFLCKGSFGAFRFLAQRWDNAKDMPTDTYIVDVYLISHTWSGERNLNTTLIRAHAKDIEEGLLHYEPTQTGLFGNKPVKRVMFDISKSGESPYLVTAENI